MNGVAITLLMMWATGITYGGKTVSYEMEQKLNKQLAVHVWSVVYGMVPCCHSGMRQGVFLWFLEPQCTDANTIFLWDGGAEHVVPLLLPIGDASPQLTLQAPRTADVHFLLSSL